MMRSRSRAVRAASLTVLPLVLAAFAIGAAVQRGDNGDSRVRTREMNGFQEIPTIMTVGVGDFEAKIDDAFIEYTLSYAGLEGGATLFAHIHFGNNYTNGGISAFLCGGGDKPPCPQVAGTISGIIDPTDVVGPTTQGIEPASFAELVRALRTGTAYVNVHTTRWPAGEIRGQIRDDRDIKQSP